MAVPKPLPPTNEDSAIQAGFAAQETYAHTLEDIRLNQHTSPLAKAEAINNAYEAHVAELDRLFTDLRSRRVARLEYLQSQIPVGAGVDNTTSPADAAVLNAAFRAALDQVRAANRGQRIDMMKQGLAYNDQTLVRAAVTYAHETSDQDLMDTWAEHTGTGDLVAEMRNMVDLVVGHAFERLWETQAFRHPEKPREVGDLARLREQAAKTERAMTETRQRERRRNYLA
ncbi:hypothetical protein ACIBG4_14925 [Nonomuraea sp. NPDC050383]|uniref:hypothetical protein n=1 Tax=Nonomuraea sp. NPDC050383 TaxID=3364362 RepID=UPI0037AF1B1B